MSHRVAKRLGLGLAVLLGLVVLALVLGYALAASQGVRDWALARAKAELAAGPGLELSLGSVEGSLVSRLHFKDLRLSRRGRLLFKADEVEFSLNLLALLGGRLRVGSLRLVRPELSLGTALAGGGGDEAAAKGGPLPLALTVNGVEIKEGRVLPDGGWGPVEEVAGIQARGRFLLDARGIRAALELARARVKLPGGELEATAKAALKGPRLEVERLHLVSGDTSLEARGRLEWSGPLWFKLKAKGRLADYALLPLAWPGPRLPEAPLDFEINLKGKAAACRLKAVFSLAGGRVELAGPVDLTLPAGRVEIGLRGFDPRAWGLADLALEASGWAELASQGRPGAPGQRASLRLDLSRLAFGNGLAGRLRLQAELEAGRVQVESLSAAGDWGSLAGGGWVRLPGREGPWELQAKLRLQGLTPPKALAERLPRGLAGLRLGGRLEAEGRPGDLRLALELAPPAPPAPPVALAPPVAAGESLVERLSLRAAWQGERWQVSRFSTQGPWGSLAAEGWLNEKSVALGVKLQVPGLEKAMEALDRLGLPAPAVRGRLEAEGRLEGPWAEPRWELGLAGSELAGFDVFLQKAKLQLRGSGWRRPRGKAVLETWELVSGEQHWDRTRLELSAGRVSWDLNLQAHSPGGWDLSLSADCPSPLPLFSSRTVTLTLRRLRLQKPGETAWIQESPAGLVLGQGKVSLPELRLKAGRQRIRVSGAWRKGGQVEAEVEVEALRLKPFVPDQPLPAGAALAARARLWGSLARPALSLQGRITGLDWPQLPPAQVEFSGGYQGETLELKGRAFSGGRPNLALAVRLGVDLGLHPLRFDLTDQGLRARAESQRFPLAMFEPLVPGVSAIKGEADLRLVASGPLEGPYVTGELVLNQGAFTINATGQSFEGVELALELKGNRMQVRRARVRSGGSLELSGWLDLPGKARGATGAGGQVSLDLRASRFHLSLGPLGSSRFNAALQARGTWRKPVITGTVRPTYLQVQVGLAPPTALEDVVVLKPGQTPPPLGRRARSLVWNPGGPLGWASVEVAADLGRGLRVELEDGWLEAVGGMQLKKEPHQPFTYHGVVKVKRGLVLLLGKRFNIQQGRLDFGGRKELNPSLDALVMLRAGKILAQIAVTGDAQNPRVQVSSEPPMSQADILSTIIFGRPAQQLDRGQSDQLSAQALALLGQQGARGISQILSPRLAPDVVTVHQDVQYGSSLEAGKYLSPDLYLRYRHNLGEEGGQNVGLEYRLYDWLSLESQIGDTRDSGVDVVYSFDFD